MTVELLGSTIGGLEDEAVGELTAITDADVKQVQPGRVLLRGDEEDIVHANLLSGTCFRFGYLVERFSLDEPEDAYGQLDIDITQYIDTDQSFTVRVERSGRKRHTSASIREELTRNIQDSFDEATGDRLDEDRDNPDIVFRLDVFKRRAYLSIDTTGRSLNRRTYLRATPEHMVPPVLANCLVRAADWEEDDTLLTLFARDGTIPIEAGRIAAREFNRKRSFAFDRLRFLDTGQHQEIRREAKERITTPRPDLEAWGTELEAARKNAAASNVTVRFKENGPLDGRFDQDHIIFRPPPIPASDPERQRKDQRKLYSRLDRRLAETDGSTIIAFTGDREFFDRFDSAQHLKVVGTTGWMLRW